ncbi:hypothetical protein GCM10009850_060800 [Nonomuraea monospora]|uniref:Smf/DprA SLOG domain-containing protein n=1 Tax=Nonomuraea monospora TaxID=568818 RepID=A0ABP5PHP5_9ACTN
MALLRAELRMEAAPHSEVDPVGTAIAQAATALARWEADGITVRTCLDERYPSQLRSIHQMPPILFTRGQQAADQRAIAVVGTRHAGERGLRAATAIARELALNGVTVVSGLASGTDTAAHQAALDAGGRTVAVIGTGIDRFHPEENRGLQERISRDGLVISQFWPGTPPERRNFPMRSAVMSGYAAATVVVEAPPQSAARTQAQLALEHGRAVVMFEELLEHEWAREHAEKAGVFVVAGLHELLAVVDDQIADLNAGPDSVVGIEWGADLPSNAWK